MRAKCATARTWPREVRLFSRVRFRVPADKGAWAHLFGLNRRWRRRGCICARHTGRFYSRAAWFIKKRTRTGEFSNLKNDYREIRGAREKSIPFRGTVVHRPAAALNPQWKINSVNWEGGYPRTPPPPFFAPFLSLFPPFFFFNFRVPRSLYPSCIGCLCLQALHRANTREECRIGRVTGWTCLSTFWNGARSFLGIDR